MKRRPWFLFVLAPLAGLLLAGCNPFGDSADRLAQQREAEGKAVGGACRHAGRAIEDCFALNKRADKPAVYAGWREMNDYMREYKIEPVVPALAAQHASRAEPAADASKPAATDAERAKPRKRDS